MTKLFEHEVKAILANAGLEVPPSVLITPENIDDPDVMSGLKGPLYVKAQITMGDRGAHGGIIAVEDCDSARAAAVEMLGSKISGLPIRAVLVEQASPGAWQGYAAITVEENPPRRVLSFDQAGGAGFDPRTAAVRMDVSAHTMPFEIRTQLRRAGIEGPELTRVASYLAGLVKAADLWSTYVLETNPIAFVDGRVVVLDAKADVDDYSKALIPGPELLDRLDEGHREREARTYQRGDHRGSLRYVQLVPEDEIGSDPRPEAKVATHSVGGGESMVVLDALSAAGLVATNYCDTSGSPSQEKVATAARLVSGQPHIDGLFFSTCIANQRLSVTARGLVEGWDAANWRGTSVARFAGNEAEEARNLVKGWADVRGVRVEVFGEEADEWQAASRLAELIREEGANR